MASTKRPTLDLTALLARAGEIFSERVGALPNVASERTKELRPRIRGKQATPSVCPYCAVGCGTTVYSDGKAILDIEGNPDSPINGGTLCPKGAATYQLHVNPARWTKAKYRAPRSAEWVDVDYDWALREIALRIKATRDRTFREFDEQGRRVARTTAVASLGGATLDNEENYLITKLFRAIGTPFVENQARI